RHRFHSPNRDRPFGMTGLHHHVGRLAPEPGCRSGTITPCCKRLLLPKPPFLLRLPLLAQTATDCELDSVSFICCHNEVVGVAVGALYERPFFSESTRCGRSAKRKRGSAQPQEIDRPYSAFLAHTSFSAC